MKSIVLEVDEASAKAWNDSSPSTRAAFEGKIKSLLKEWQEILKAEAGENTEPYKWWNDEEMVAELDRRYEDLRSGKDPGISWDDLKKDLLSRHKTR